jgi:hypothetical protein
MFKFLSLYDTGVLVGSSINYNYKAHNLARKTIPLLKDWVPGYNVALAVMVMEILGDKIDEY